MGFWVNDLRHAARRLAKARSFFITVTLMLALGIGATTTIFSSSKEFFYDRFRFVTPAAWCSWGNMSGKTRGSGLRRETSGPIRLELKLSCPPALSPEPVLYSLMVLPLKISLRRA